VAGYSATPLAKKLGIRDGSEVWVFRPPPDYRRLVAPLPKGARLVARMNAATEIAHLFITRRAELARRLEALLGKMPQDGAIWVSWPKKSSKVPTDITEDTIRELALPLGLVDIKVCAVDETWSGLKLVIRKENRRS
jgi:hypothetical protein